MHSIIFLEKKKSPKLSRNCITTQKQISNVNHGIFIRILTIPFRNRWVKCGFWFTGILLVKPTAVCLHTFLCTFWCPVLWRRSQCLVPLPLSVIVHQGSQRNCPQHHCAINWNEKKFKKKIKWDRNEKEQEGLGYKTEIQWVERWATTRGKRWKRNRRMELQSTEQGAKSESMENSMTEKVNKQEM